MEQTQIDSLVMEVAFLTSEIRELKGLLSGLNIDIPTEKFISKKELAKRLSISVWKVTEMTDEKTIPHVRAGVKYLYDYKEVLRSIKVKQRN